MATGFKISDGTDLEEYFSLCGMIAYFGTTSAPSKYWLICNGQAVSRTTYAALFAKVGTRFGAGNGSTTFNLPNLIDRFPQGATSGIGTIVEAGLPNITGEFAADDRGGHHQAGAFTFCDGTGPDTTATGGDGVHRYFDFDASRSSPIYGNSDTVQPPALKLLPCIHI